MLKVCLFGQFDLRLEDQRLELSSRSAQTLLAYLLLHRQVAHRRERLAGLLWPDSPESSARKGLRNALWHLRRTIGDAYLVADRSSIAFNSAAPYTLDVAILESEVETDEPEQMMRLVSVYQGDLLPGFYEDWVLLERERLRSLYERRIQALLDRLVARGRWPDVQTWAERWIALGHVPEPAYRALMTAYAGLADLAGMANSYQRCVQALDEELGVSPSTETQALYERLRQRDESSPRPHQPEAQAAPTIEETLAPRDASQSTLPAYATPFVGRQEELAEIGRLLAHEPDCRLLTLLGPGGIGKTRLAIEVARAVQFTHGVYFVSLAPLDSGASLFSAIADALRLRLDGAADHGAQLFAYLRQRELLLVLDNFEHLLSPLHEQEEESGQDATRVLTELLEHVPRVRLLVTSRERLNLNAEWVFTVEGLQIPALLKEAPEGQIASFSAVQLFLQRARQLERSFGREADELACVARICRLLGGLPLAIELAAAWTNALTCHHILQEIERSHTFLHANLRDHPERHRDIRAVFDTSWNMLTDPERRIFRQLSVFRGGFTRAAAEAIGGAFTWAEDDLSLHDGTLRLAQGQPEVLVALAGLVDKSFVRHTAAGRYEIHELMRQYGAAKLLERPEEERLTRDNHARYYLTFLIQQDAPLTGPRQQESVEMVDAEMENINRAWKWAVARGKLALLDRALGTYFNFCLTRSRLQEGEEAFARLVNRLQRGTQLREHPHYDVILGRAFIRLAALYYSLGNYDDARRCAKEGLASGLGDAYRSDIAFAQIVLGVVAGWQGDKALAEEWLHKSLAISREIDDKENTADALHELAQIHSSFGDYREAKRLAQESLDISRAYGRPDWVAHALVILGWAVVCLGEYTRAEEHYREALTIFRSLENRQGAADALDGLGWAAWCQENFDEAAHYYDQSLAMIRELGHRRILANTLCDLAILANEQDDFAKAEAISREGLGLAEELDSVVYRVPYLCCLGSAACGTGHFSESHRYLGEALQLAYDTRLLPPLMLILYEYGSLLLQEMETKRAGDATHLKRITFALELLTFVIHHPATWHAVRHRANRIQAQLKGKLPVEVVAAAKTRGQHNSLDDVVVALLQPLQEKW